MGAEALLQRALQYEFIARHKPFLSPGNEAVPITADLGKSLSLGAVGSDIKILVLPDDSFVDSLPGSTSISDYIEVAIKEQFSRYHYDVKGKAQLSGHSELRQKFPTNLTSGELIVIAERAKATNDAALNALRALVVYKAFPDIDDDRTGASMTIEISGEVHDLDAKRFIGKFGPMRSKAFPIPSSCTDRKNEAARARCVSAIAREKSNDIAMTVAEQARVKLALLTKPGFGAPVGATPSAATPTATASPVRPRTDRQLLTSYSMRFENLTMPEVLNIKGQMEGEFPDFVRTERFSGSPPFVTFGYVSYAPQDKIVGWMYVLLNDMGLRSPVVNIRAEGTTVTVERLGSDSPPPRSASGSGLFR